MVSHGQAKDFRAVSLKLRISPADFAIFALRIFAAKDYFIRSTPRNVRPDGLYQVWQPRGITGPAVKETEFDDAVRHP
jgi:hypothetical protein